MNILLPQDKHDHCRLRYIPGPIHLHIRESQRILHAGKNSQILDIEFFHPLLWESISDLRIFQTQIFSVLNPEI